jgi:uncharacterized protein
MSNPDGAVLASSKTPKEIPVTREPHRIRLYFLFLLCGIATGAAVLLSSNIIVGVILQVVISLTFLFVSLRMRSNDRFHRYWEVFYAFFISSVVVLLRSLAIGLVILYGSASSLSGQELIAIADFIATVSVIIVLTKASGRSLSSLYLRTGNLRLGLTVGIIAFSVFAVGILLSFQFLYGNPHGISFTRLLSFTPLLLAASALNAPKEELWFRGLFLGKYQPLLGRAVSNLLQAPLFMLAHVELQYAQFGVAFLFSFLALTFIAGIAAGYLIQKTDSLIGSSIAHAGADVGVFLLLLLSLL